MAIEAVYKTQADIPEQYAELYAERNGQWELSGINGVKTQADIERVTTSLTHERTNHSKTKEQLAAWMALERTPEEIQADLARIPELEAASQGSLDEDKLSKLVEARVATQMAPVNKDVDKLRKEAQALAEENNALKEEKRVRTIHDNIRSAGTKSKVLDTAMEDILMLSERVFEISEAGEVVTRDGVGVTPGINAETWLSEMQDRRPHWWPPSQGGGARDGSPASGFADNPFSNEHWSLTAQGAAYRENPERAARMAKAAGTTIGGPRPNPRKAA